MTSLTERLRAETRALHTVAERSPFMLSLLRGKMTRPAYVALLENLSVIYAALEPALVRHAGHPALAPLRFEGLARSAALRADITALGSAPTTSTIVATTHRYVGRLHELDAHRPELLLAHAYVRYLGDLSGGQLLRRVVVESPQLAAGDAVSFYDFGDADAVAKLARDFRAGLDRVMVEAHDELVAEAIVAFEWHRSLFDELDQAHGGTAGAAAGNTAR